MSHALAFLAKDSIIQVEYEKTFLQSWFRENETFQANFKECL